MKVNTRKYKGIIITTDDKVKRNFRADFNMVYELQKYNITDMNKLDDFTIFMILYAGLKHELEEEVDIEVFELLVKASFKEIKGAILEEYISCMIHDFEEINKPTKKKNVNEKSNKGIDLDYFHYIHEVVLKLKGDFWNKTPSYLFSMIQQHKKFNSSGEDHEESKLVPVDEAF